MLWFRYLFFVREVWSLWLFKIFHFQTTRKSSEVLPSTDFPPSLNHQLCQQSFFSRMLTRSLKMWTLMSYLCTDGPVKVNCRPSTNRPHNWGGCENRSWDNKTLGASAGRSIWTIWCRFWKSCCLTPPTSGKYLFSVLYRSCLCWEENKLLSSYSFSAI